MRGRPKFPKKGFIFLLVLGRRKPSKALASHSGSQPLESVPQYFMKKTGVNLVETRVRFAGTVVLPIAPNRGGHEL